jgi:tetratricopeptide (TPR) repeat protein
MGEVESGGPARGAGLELVLERGGAYVALARQPLGPGVVVEALALEVPDVRFPFDVAAGAAQFRDRLGVLERLEVTAGPAALERLAARLDLAAAGFASLALALRAGFVEVFGRLLGGAPFTMRAVLVPAGAHGLAVHLLDARLYGPAPISAARLPALAARAAAPLAPGRGDGGAVAAEPLAPLLRLLLAPRGWKVPRLGEAWLAALEVAPACLRLAWDRRRAAAAPSADPDLLAAVEGARAFADAEALLAAGDEGAAREAYLALGDAAAGHPFGAARLLALLAAHEPSHDAALDLAAAWTARRPDFAPALAAAGLVRAARGEAGPASAAFADLAALSARRGEEAAALCAADAALALGPGAVPAAVARAVEVALGLRRDHLPALRALLSLGAQGGDREALLRACRRLAAYAPGADEKADAHARLGSLLLEGDPAAARLHLDHALRLAPSDPGTLRLLARACEAAGEHLRAVRALDRLRELARQRGDEPAAAEAAGEVADLWERAGQPENALLRAREACEAAPSAAAEERAARLAASLGRDAEAADHLAAALSLLDPAAPDAGPRGAALRRELARIAEERLGDPGRAADHLEALLAGAPDDLAAARELARLARAAGDAARGRAALDRLARVSPDAEERAAAAVAAARLPGDDPAGQLARWRAAAALRPDDAAVHEALAEAAAAAGDAAAAGTALARLAALTADGEPRARVLDRVRQAHEDAGDVAGALLAAAAARAAAASPERLGAELRLARLAGDAARLAALLGEASAGLGPAEAAAALVERARLLAGAAPEAALEAAWEATRRDPSSAEAWELAAELAAGREPTRAARALLERAALARDRGEPDAVLRLLAAGQAALETGAGEDGEAALRAALALDAEPEAARAAWSALAARAAARGDAAGEREALAALVPLLPTGQKAAAWLRLARLALASGDAVTGRAAAEAGRRLAPRDPAAIEACREAADAGGDAAAVPPLLEALAGLDPARRGPLLLERAQRLAALGELAAADDAFGEALAALAPDEALAAEHVRLRRGAPPPVGARPWSEPLERLALRLPAGAAAGALRAAAALADEQGDLASALRCARAALAASDGELAASGPLLFRLLYRAGAAAEARELGRRLLDAGLPDAADRADAWRDLAEVALDGGDDTLALAALDRLLAARPHDVEAALSRFALDPDRARGVRALAEAGAASRRGRLAADALATAAAAARRDLRDPALADALFARARAAARGRAATLAHVEALRAEAARADAELDSAVPPAELIDALRDLAAACASAGDAVGARRATLELARLEAEHGSAREAAARLWPLVAADPADAEAGALLDGALAPWPAERARLLRLRAGAAADAARAALLRDAARALLSAGEPAAAREATLDAFDAWPADDAAFVAALREAADDVALLDRVLAARAAAVPAEAAGCHRARADALLAFGREGAAEEAYERCLAHDPRDAAALAWLAGARAARGDGADALPLDARLAALAEAGELPVGAAAEAASRYRLGLAAWEARRADEAAHHLARALALAPGDPLAPRALEALARAEAQRGDLAAALGAARRLADAAEDPGTAREALRFGVELAARAGDRGRDAADLLERLAAAELSARGEGADALAERAVEALLRAGENARAGALLARAARAFSGPRRARWLARLAAAAAARGDLASARAAREEALLADPSDAALREAHLADLEARGDAAAVARVLESALAAGAEPAPLLLRLARARDAFGDAPGAEASYASLAALGPAAPGHAEAERALEAALSARGDRAGLARLALARAERAAPGARAAALVEAAAHLAASGALSEACATAQRACEDDPDLAASWRALASARAATGEPDAAARALLAAALRSEGRDAAEAALEAARLFECAGRADDAARAFAAAAAAWPGAPEARRALAARARTAGDLAAAARHLRALDAEALPSDERGAHERALARALSDADMPEADAAWQRLFDADASDTEAFTRLGSAAVGRGEPERWLELAARHDGALAGGDAAPRRDLRCERAALLTELGRLDAAEGAWQAALALDPSHRRALRGLRGLLESRGDHAAAADVLAREAEVAGAPLDAAGLLVEAARLRLERVADREGAAGALEAALAHLRGVLGEEADALRGQADRMMDALRAPAHPPVDARATLQWRPDSATPLEAAAPEASADGAPSAEPADPARPGASEEREASAARAPDAAPAATAEPRHTLARTGEHAGSIENALESAAAEAETSASPPAPGSRSHAPTAIDPPAPTPPAHDTLGLHALAASAPPPAAPAPQAEPPPAPQPGPSDPFAAALAALEAAPSRADLLERALALAAGDPARAIAAHRLAVKGAARPAERAAALRALGAVLARSPETLPEAAEVLERAQGLDPASGATAAALARAFLALGYFERAAGALAPFAGGAPDLPAAEAAELLARARRTTPLPAPMPDLAQLLAQPSAAPAPPSAPRGPSAAAPSPRPSPPLRVGEGDTRPSTPSASASAAPGSATPRLLAASADPRTRAALASALARARSAPFDASALDAVAELARAAATGAPTGGARRLAVLARATKRLAGLARGTAAPPSAAARVRLSPEARDAALLPMARGAPARLLALLAPWLESLFPADLARRGVGGRHRVGLQRAPDVLQALEEAQRALGARPFAAFLADAGGPEIAIENTRPPSLVFGAGFASRPDGERRFLAARALALADLGWALAGKFAPRDVGVLLELSARFAGGRPPSLGLPPERAPAFLAALERVVPPSVQERARALGERAAAEVAAIAPRELASALRQSASRTALVHAGDARSAVEALLVAEPRIALLPRAEALSHPDVRDLVAFALSDEHLELRAAAEEGR